MNDFSPPHPERFAAAIARFDAENARDPRKTTDAGAAQPLEVAYSRWLTGWVLRLRPDASEALRLAARSQHLCRWEIPRESYPATRAGYLQWRQKLKAFHADKAAEILRAVGYDQETVQRVHDLNLKRHFPEDAEARTLEDALCLLFLERQFAELAQKTTREKMIGALQKCWAKMTPAARSLAGTIMYGPLERQLLTDALASPDAAG
ncbi:MAG TPA: DUF4202 domain-containing protein [Verrucomicrobiae bacterium]|nr:DUF4202 domain-containing protein [Verrucomicrobiae bacterium]